MGYLADFLTFCIAVFGATNIIVASALMKPIRDFITFKEMRKDDKGVLVGVTLRSPVLLGKLINCPMCLGFWIAIFFSVMVWSPASNVMGKSIAYNHVLGCLYDGCIGSITSWVAYLSISKLQFGK